jgi:hypothetical protein
VLAPGDASVDAQARRADLTVVEGGSADGIPGNLLVIDPPAGSALLGGIATVRSPGMTAIDSTSPLLQGVDLSSLVLYTALAARLPGWAHVAIGSTAGPLLFDGTAAGRRVAVLLVDPQTGTGARGIYTGSNLSTLLAFPTLLQNAVQALSLPAPSGALAGQVRAEPATGSTGTRLLWAAGRATALSTAGNIVALPPLAPGAYSLSGGATGPLVVNAPVPEDPLAQPAPLPAAPVGGAPAIVVPHTAPWEIWMPAILLALLVLCGEWWYYARRT